MLTRRVRRRPQGVYKDIDGIPVYPGSSSTITGIGIHTAGAGTGSGTASVAIYLPIDYIDDHITSVSTIKQ